MKLAYGQMYDGEDEDLIANENANKDDDDEDDDEVQTVHITHVMKASFKRDIELSCDHIYDKTFIHGKVIHLRIAELDEEEWIPRTRTG